MLEGGSAEEEKEENAGCKSCVECGRGGGRSEEIQARERKKKEKNRKSVLDLHLKGGRINEVVLELFWIKTNCVSAHPPIECLGISAYR